MQSSSELRKLLKEALIREAKERNEPPLARFGWHPDPTKITREQTIELRAAHTLKGYNKAKLASIGVPWPAPHNWKSRLIHAAVEYHGIKDVNREARKLNHPTDASAGWPVIREPQRKVFTKHVPRTAEEVRQAKSPDASAKPSLPTPEPFTALPVKSYASVSDLLAGKEEDDSPPWTP